MNGNLQRLIELEAQLSTIRKEISSIAALDQSTGKLDPMMADRIRFLENEVAHVNYQLSLIKQGTSASAAPVVDEVNKGTVGTFSSNKEFVESVMPWSDVSTTRPVAPVQEKKESTQPKTTVIKEKNLETTIGKSVMAIAASVLIFISLILFATLLYPLLNDAMKISAMYIISALFSAVGFGLMKKDSENKLNLSLAGCGLGCFFISILLSNIYFRIIGTFAVFALIFVWAIVALLLYKKVSKVFFFIGEIGLTISIIFGSVYVSVEMLIPELIALTGYFVLTSAVYYYVSFDKNNIKNLYHLIPNIISLIALTTAIRTVEVTWIGAIVLVYVLANGAVQYLLVNKENEIIFILLTVFYYFMTWGCIEFLISEKSISHVVVAGMSLGLVVINRVLLKDRQISRLVLDIIFNIVVLIYAMNLHSLSAVIILATGYALYYFLTYKRQSVEHLIILYGYFIIEAGMLYFKDWDIAFIIVTAAMIASVYYMVIKSYNMVLKLVNYGMLIMLICYYVALICNYLPFAFVDDIEIAFIILAILNTVLMFSSYTKNWITGEKEKASEIVFYICHIMYMIGALEFIVDVNGFNLILIPLAVVLFSVNNKKLLAESSTYKWIGYYIGAKYTVLMGTILYAYDIDSVIFSICYFVFAIICILVGFWQSNREVRMFGLILSMISVVKLIMIDISHENTLSLALSFFVCGVLCFAISFIYNKIDKHTQKQETE